MVVEQTFPRSVGIPEGNSSTRLLQRFLTVRGAGSSCAWTTYSIPARVQADKHRPGVSQSLQKVIEHALLPQREFQVKLDEHTGELANGPEHSPETIALSSNFPVVEGQVNANGIEVLIDPFYDRGITGGHS